MIPGLVITIGEIAHCLQVIDCRMRHETPLIEERIFSGTFLRQNIVMLKRNTVLRKNIGKRVHCFINGFECPKVNRGKVGMGIMVM